MNRRLSALLSSLAAALLLSALALTSRASAHHASGAADPFSSPLHLPPAHTAPPPPCTSGPGAAASTLTDHVSIPDLPDLARRAFTLERLAESARSGPAFPQRMGLAATPCP